jgi:hypothetical protein
MYTGLMGGAEGRAPSRWLRWLNATLLVLGAIALVWMFRAIGVDVLLDGMEEIGIGFAVAVLVHFVGQASGALALQACCGPEGQRHSYWMFLRANLAGHAINEATPMRIGEITKFTLLAESMPRSQAAAALIVHNILFIVANCILLATAPLAAIWVLGVDGHLATILMIGGGAFLLVGVVFVLFMLRGPGELPFRLLGRVMRQEKVDRLRIRWQSTERLWMDFTRNRRLMLTAAWSSFIARATAVVEGIVILSFLYVDNAIALGFVSFASFQLVVWFSFVPFQAGAAEGAAFVVFSALKVPAAFGVLVELARKVRKLVFIGLGVSLLGWHTFRSLAATRDESGATAGRSETEILAAEVLAAADAAVEDADAAVEDADAAVDDAVDAADAAVEAADAVVDDARREIAGRRR